MLQLKAVYIDEDRPPYPIGTYSSNTLSERVRHRQLYGEEIDLSQILMTSPTSREVGSCCFIVSLFPSTPFRLENVSYIGIR